MRTITTARPHGYLLWKGKQTALASDRPLPAGEPALVVCDGEAYGEVVLAQPAAVNLAEFERLQPEHCVSPAERALYWPDVKAFYIHRFRAWRPYPEARPVEAIEPTEAEQVLLEQAEQLPKTVVLAEAVNLGHKLAVLQPAELDAGRIEAMVKATLGETRLEDGRYVPLYQLALVRQPRLMVKAGQAGDDLKKKEGGGDPAARPDEAAGIDLAAGEEFKRMEGETMPYEIRDDHPDCSGYAVVKSDTDEVVKCHEMMEEAEAHMAALRINVEGEEKAASLERLTDHIRQTFAGQFGDEPAVREIFPDHVVAQSVGRLYKAAYTTDGELVQFVQREQWQPVELAYIPATGWGKAAEAAEGEKVGRRLKKSWRARLKEMYDSLKELMNWAEYEDEDEPGQKALAVAVKEVNGQPWFFAHSTNAFEDRENEIFSAKSLERYVAEAEASGSRGFFNFWHIPGTDFAAKQWQGVVGRFLVEAGPFLDDDKGRAALEFFKQHPAGHPDIAPEGWGCSPEYRYLPEERKSGVYDWIWITRTSALPRAAAANIWTKGGIMALSEQQRKAAEEMFGAELTARIIAEAEAQTKELEQAGVATKEAEPEAKEAKEEDGPVEESMDGGADIDQIVEAVMAKLDIDQIVEAVMAKIDGKEKALDPEALTSALAVMATKMDELVDRVKGLETAGDLKQQIETPRWLFQAVERASQATKTEVKDGEDFNKPKEAQTPAKDASGAAHFFPAR